MKTSYIERTAQVFLSFGVVMLLGITILFLLKTTPLFHGSLETKIWSDYGGVISGTVGTLFSLVAMLFLIVNLNDQRKNTARQTIETRFYQLLQIHRDNVVELNSNEQKGRALFIRMKDEFHDIHEKLHTAMVQQSEKAPALSEEAEVNIAYLIWFFGVHKSSEEYLHSQIENIIKGDKANKDLNEVIKEQCIGKLKEAHKAVVESNEVLRNGGHKEKYVPYDGHQSNMGHYFRHLFQTVRYINEQPPDLLTYREKCVYIKALRAQLSTYEQAIFFYNSLSELGKPWEKGENIPRNEQLITKYNLIKNLPYGFTLGLSPIKAYPKIFFEHQPKEIHAARLEWEKQYS